MVRLLQYSLKRGGFYMEQEIRAFLNKFIASLSVKGVESIPFAGDAFQEGISAVEDEWTGNFQE